MNLQNHSDRTEAVPSSYMQDVSSAIFVTTDPSMTVLCQLQSPSITFQSTNTLSISRTSTWSTPPSAFPTSHVTASESIITSFCQCRHSPPKTYARFIKLQILPTYRGPYRARPNPAKTLRSTCTTVPSLHIHREPLKACSSGMNDTLKSDRLYLTQGVVLGDPRSVWREC